VCVYVCKQEFNVDGIVYGKFENWLHRIR
jgi:hypothetical protein